MPDGLASDFRFPGITSLFAVGCPAHAHHNIVAPVADFNAQNSVTRRPESMDQAERRQCKHAKQSEQRHAEQNAPPRPTRLCEAGV